jgi:hypothetical protein
MRVVVSIEKDKRNGYISGIKNMEKKGFKNRKFKVVASIMIIITLVLSGISIVCGMQPSNSVSILVVEKEDNGIESIDVLSDKLVDNNDAVLRFSSDKSLINNISMDYSRFNNPPQPLVPHPIYGTATWDSGGKAVNASVEVVSSIDTLTATVGSGGSWQVDCGDPGPNWASGTSFTVYINGTGTHQGWYGIASGSVSGYYNNMGNIVVYQNSDTPYTPKTPDGSKSGKINVKYTYSTFTTDPNGDNVYYLFDWDDGSDSIWLGPYDSGQTIKASHIWTEKGNYEIKVKAKDIHDFESGWSDPLSLTIPRNKITTNFLFQRFLENHPNMLPILQKLLSR